MPFRLFHDLFPEVAERETRTASVLQDEGGALPGDTYGFLEMYCDERGCDCRRVYFSVLARSRGRTMAQITWGWESADFYRGRSSFELSPADLAELTGPALASGQPQTELGPALVEFVRDTLLADSAYVERIQCHYRMFREAIDKPSKTDWWRKERKRR